MTGFAAHLAWIVPSLITLGIGVFGVIVGHRVTLSVLKTEMQHVCSDVAEVKQQCRDGSEERRRLWTTLDTHNGLINRIMGRLGMNGGGTSPVPTGG